MQLLKAAVDIGTNSTRLLIAEVDNGLIVKDLERQARITRLGATVHKTKKLSAAAVKRTYKALSLYKSLIDEYGVAQVKAAATSAARDAVNAADFINGVKAEFGFKVEVISGEEEAELSYLGATSDFILEDDADFLVIDIGGGSVELIYGDKNGPKKTVSLDIGCVRLTEMFLRDDPPTAAQIKNLRAYARKILNGADIVTAIVSAKPMSAIAVAGTSTTLAAIDMEMVKYNADLIHGRVMGRRRLEELAEELATKKIVELRQVPGLQPARADVIVAGAVVQSEIMRQLGLTAVTVSEKDVLDGLILSK